MLLNQFFISFDSVFINLTMSTNYGFLKSDDEKEFLSKQRRWFYVALTRTKKYLVLSSFAKIQTKMAYDGCAYERNQITTVRIPQ